MYRCFLKTTQSSIFRSSVKLLLFFQEIALTWSELCRQKRTMTTRLISSLTLHPTNSWWVFNRMLMRWNPSPWSSGTTSMTLSAMLGEDWAFTWDSQSYQHSCGFSKDWSSDAPKWSHLKLSDPWLWFMKICKERQYAQICNLIRTTYWLMILSNLASQEDLLSRKSRT